MRRRTISLTLWVLDVVAHGLDGRRRMVWILPSSFQGSQFCVQPARSLLSILILVACLHLVSESALNNMVSLDAYYVAARLLTFSKSTNSILKNTLQYVLLDIILYCIVGITFSRLRTRTGSHFSHCSRYSGLIARRRYTGTKEESMYRYVLYILIQHRHRH
jgi:hypothetical protein